MNQGHPFPQTLTITLAKSSVADNPQAKNQRVTPAYQRYGLRRHQDLAIGRRTVSTAMEEIPAARDSAAAP
jgi:hypothetical protein